MAPKKTPQKNHNISIDNTYNSDKSCNPQDQPTILGFHDPQTGTISYLVLVKGTKEEEKSAVIIDPVLDFDISNGRTSTDSADRLIAAAHEHRARVEWVLETHIHADHLSAAPYLRRHFDCKVGIGSRVAEVQKIFGRIFCAEVDFLNNRNQFDHLFADGETFSVGTLMGSVRHTPGHTSACSSYLIGDACFVGDTLFMPDSGTARCDFPGGDARSLYRSIHQLLAQQDEIRLFACHDYRPGGRQALWKSTVAEQKAHNIHIRNGISEEAFVRMRKSRDATLAMPKLIIPSVQVNIQAGRMPAPEENGIAYLKLPLNTL